MKLQERLDAMKAASVAKISAETRAIMARATDALERSGILDRTISTGDPAPLFELPNQDGEIVRLAELLRRGPAVVSFFRGVWCPYCNAELEALEAAANDFRAAGATLVVISPQNRAAAARTKHERGLSCDVLVDSGNAYARRLGIVFELPEELREVYRSFRIDLTEYNDEHSWSLPMPARLVIDERGTVCDARIDPDYTVRPDPAETLAALRKLRAAA